MEKSKQKSSFNEIATASILVLISCLAVVAFVISMFNSASIIRNDKALDFNEIVSGDEHSYELGELKIDYDDDNDKYDCWLEEEHRHVYIKGKDVLYRLSDDQDVVLYEVDGKEILVIYFTLNLKD